MCAGEPFVCGRTLFCRGGRGGRARQLALDSRAGWLLQDDGQSQDGLVFQNRTGCGSERTLDQLSARQSAGRVQLDQRAALCVAVSHRISTAGGNWATRAGPGTTCCPTSRNPRIGKPITVNCAAPTARCRSRPSASRVRSSTSGSNPPLPPDIKKPRITTAKTRKACPTSSSPPIAVADAAARSPICARPRNART